MRYVLDIAYDGTGFAGWQRQPNAHTVQAELEAALSTALRQQTSCTGAGRTDAGVHARQLIVHFDHPEALPPRFFHSLNALLPATVSVNGLYRTADPDFHSRFHAVRRAYIYQIIRKKSPFYRDQATWVRHELDLAAMQAAAAVLPEYEDFASFCKAHGAHETTLCRMDAAFWQEEGDLLCFHIAANRFLRGMVRAIVGTLLEVGRGRRDIADFRRVIEARDRRAAGANAPPQGLFLTEVSYPEGSLIPLL
ncbi:MAG: tRNA pseudouridine(38-40) synthase TruA [Bacteroidetes bacterium]|nr:MAG: tRNA pseudouridine(38-40) synthase TruA [Bacteroidota bacterium]